MADEVWSVRRLLEWTAGSFKDRGVDSPRLEAEILLAHALKCPSRVMLYLKYDEVPGEEERSRFRELVKRRLCGEPVAYLVGYKEFYSLDFEVNSDVLIPRPETEKIALAGIEFIRGLRKAALEAEVKPGNARSSSHRAESPEGESELSAKERGALAMEKAPITRILDIGTGSGALAVVLAKNLPRTEVVAVDISPAALAVAKGNAERNGVAVKIDFRQSDLFSAVRPDERFTLIVSNPPYVTEAEYAELEPSVRNFEPRGALVSGPKGTEILERILKDAPARLVPGGRCYIEISPMIAGECEVLLKKSEFKKFSILNDNAKLKRVICAEIG